MCLFLLTETLPTIDTSLDITGIIAIAAIISPVFVSLINNYHQMNLKKIEVEQKQYEENQKMIKQIYLNYLKFAGKCLASCHYDSSSEYGEWYFQLLIYVPKDISERLEVINALIINEQFDSATLELESIIPKLKEQLNKL